MPDLIVETNEEYAIDETMREQFDAADIDGSADVDGHLIIRETSPTFRSSEDDFSFPAAIDFPTGSLLFSTMNMGTAVFFGVMLFFFGGATMALRNYIAGTLLGIAVLVLLLSGTIGIPLELFWAVLILTAMALIAGIAFRIAQ